MTEELPGKIAVFERRDAPTPSFRVPLSSSDLRLLRTRGIP